MDYPLCLRSAKSPTISPTTLFPKSMTISSRISTTNKLLFTPTTNPTTISSKLRNITNKPHFYTTNYHSNSRAQINFSDRYAAADGPGSRPGRARGAAPGASVALACSLGVFCFGAAALAIGAGKASSARTGRWFSMGGGDGPVEGPQPQQNSFSPLSQKDVVLSLSKTRRYLASSLESRSSTTPADLDSQKRNALEEIKKGKDIEMALIEMKKKQGIDSASREGNYQIKMEAIEILIAQGKFDKALEVLEPLKNENEFIPSDLRPSLYMAIIYTIRYDKNNPPDEHWDKFFDDSEVPDPTRQ